MADDHPDKDSCSECPTDRPNSGRNWRLGAWLPWVVLHVPISWLILHSGGPGRGAVELALYTIFSWGLCIPTLLVFACHRKHGLSYLITVCLLLLGPVLSAHYLGSKNKEIVRKAHAAAEEVSQLCEDRGGDKIYRTVEGVEGVFQLVPMPRFHKGLDDQFGRVYPWHRQMGERSRMNRFISPDGRGYLFVEHLPSHNHDGPPYLRTVLQHFDRSMGDQNTDQPYSQRPDLTASTLEVNQLRSRYGWVSEDLTTAEMREKWIAGGRTKVLDLRTNEVLAERTGFFLAMGRGQYPWHNEDIVLAGCPRNSTTTMFITTVLVPISEYPTEEKLESLKD